MLRLHNKAIPKKPEQLACPRARKPITTSPAKARRPGRSEGVLCNKEVKRCRYRVEGKRCRFRGEARRGGGGMLKGDREEVETRVESRGRRREGGECVSGEQSPIKDRKMGYFYLFSFLFICFFLSLPSTYSLLYRRRTIADKRWE